MADESPTTPPPPARVIYGAPGYSTVTRDSTGAEPYDDLPAIGRALLALVRAYGGDVRLDPNERDLYFERLERVPADATRLVRAYSGWIANELRVERAIQRTARSAYARPPAPRVPRRIVRAR